MNGTSPVKKFYATVLDDFLASCYLSMLVFGVRNSLRMVNVFVDGKFCGGGCEPCHLSQLIVFVIYLVCLISSLWGTVLPVTFGF